MFDHILAIHSLPITTSFFFNDTATTEIYTLSLHDALPISGTGRRAGRALVAGGPGHHRRGLPACDPAGPVPGPAGLGGPGRAARAAGRADRRGPGPHRPAEGLA